MLYMTIDRTRRFVDLRFSDETDFLVIHLRFFYFFHKEKINGLLMERPILPPLRNPFSQNPSHGRHPLLPSGGGIEYIAPVQIPKTSFVAKLSRVFSLTHKRERYPSQGKHDYALGSNKNGHIRAVSTSGFRGKSEALESLREAGFMPREVSNYRGEFGPVVEVERATPSQARMNREPSIPRWQ